MNFSWNFSSIKVRYLLLPIWWGTKERHSPCIHARHSMSHNNHSNLNQGGMGQKQTLCLKACLQNVSTFILYTALVLKPVAKICFNVSYVMTSLKISLLAMTTSLTHQCHSLPAVTRVFVCNQTWIFFWWKWDKHTTAQYCRGELIIKMYSICVCHGVVWIWILLFFFF